MERAKRTDLRGRIFVRKSSHTAPGVDSRPMKVRAVRRDGMLLMSDGCEWEREALRLAGWYLKKRSAR